MKHKCRWVLLRGCPLSPNGLPSSECEVKSVYGLCPHYKEKKVN